jgi:steroid 5-alpha reductase family enzyme
MTFSPFPLVLYGWLLTAVLMAGLWWVQKVRQDASHVDVAWAAGLGLLAIFYAALADGYLPRRFGLAVLVGVWAFRLALYLFLNRVWGKPEDGRYQSLRQHWGEKAQPYFFLFFQAQALVAVIFSLPFLVIVSNATPAVSGWEGSGVCMWLAAVVGESIADRQLARFRADPRNRGKTCRIGLWRYSRHPNYFFEWLHWWTYVLMGVGCAFWWLTWIGPGLMLYLLFKVTGIPATEAQAVASRGDDYRAYQRTTSAFIPWFPKMEKA